MGRVKLKIKKLESSGSRQVTYSKRKNGIVKKARELCILCDIDILLLMFSPTARPTLYQGERSNIHDVITKFAQLTPQERAKRKLENLDTLKKTFYKLGHDVNIHDFHSSSSQDVEELSHEVGSLRDQIAHLHNRLSYWKNLDNINNIQHLQHMQDLITDSLNQTRLYKENVGRQLVASQDMSSQYPSGGISLPLIMDEIQGTQQPLAWISNYEDTQHIALPNEGTFMQAPAGDAECSAMSTSFPSYSSLFNHGKQIEGDDGGGGFINELIISGGGNSNGSTSTLQLGNQLLYPYHQTTSDSTCDNIAQLNGKLEVSTTLYDHHPWPSIPPHHCTIPMFQTNAYHHQSN